MVPDSGHAAGLTVSAGDLAGALAREPHPVVLDVRWNLSGPPAIDAYREGHLPGARFIDLDGDLAGDPGQGRGRHPLPDQRDFETSMRRAGVSRRTPVVVYDAGGGLSAARAWWLLRYFGHEAVSLLDGGLAAWLAAGGPTSSDEPPSALGDFIARPGAMAVLDAAGAVRLVGDGTLLDARAAERYRGEMEPVDPVAGHIPGAVSAPTTDNLGPDGAFLHPYALRERFEALGVRPDKPAGAYCGSGVTAAHEVLALALAGIPAALYAGSWSAWISDPTRPVAVGDAPG